MPFQNATVELADPGHPGTAFSAGSSRRFGELLRGLIAESVGEKAGEAARPLWACWSRGAIVTAVIQGKPDAVEVAREAACRADSRGGRVTLTSLF